MQTTVAIAYDKEGNKYDECWTWETAQTLANEGYQIVAIDNDGHMTKQDIQNLCDAEFARVIDCFGESYAK